jgi:hypothetical protein
MDDIRQTALAHLDRLMMRGRQIAERLKTTPGRAVDIRAWQQDCAAAINELSGGSKAHWLSRAFSQAFLVRPPGNGVDGVGGIVTEASPADIVDRLLAVLAQANTSLASMDPIDPASAAVTAAPAPRRFDFVHNEALRPVLERANVESAQALEAGDFHHALMTSCSILETIITDALEQVRLKAEKVRLKPDATSEGGSETASDGGSEGEAVTGTFAARIAAAERAGLIRGGCARLPAVARTYRDLAPDAAVSERDAKVARQVLNVVMRDLDPGR